MKLTRHARIRSQQRNISIEDIGFLISYGKPSQRPGNVTEYRIGKRIKTVLWLKKNENYIF